ncbi:MAG: EamA family transporter [Desulfovibrio sp.]|jgi:drug/metabolite transporter (DMT)-like permease|nr:EamA family transporter [Desulfovibrio sp.]
MTSLAFLLWLVNMSMDTFGHLSFKIAASRGGGLSTGAYWRQLLKHPWLWAGISCYVCEFFVWVAFLSQVPLGVGVMLGSFNIVLLMIAGRLLFKEMLTGWRIFGIVLITLGVILVGMGE